MSSGKSSSLPAARCNHATLTFVSSPHSTEVRFKTKVKRIESGETYPGPLILPDDELSINPRYPPQSLRTWLREGDRNEVTPERKTIYVAAPPGIESDVSFVSRWSQPSQHDVIEPSAAPAVQDLVAYLTAFYHPLPVKLLPSPKLCFMSWENDRPKISRAGSKSTIPRYIGLSTSTECIRIRTRASKGGVFNCQLNLDDIIDAAISTVPADAYALLLLTHHDLFENADDEFVCGRAYGGSRVAVISTARYNPALDMLQDVEREHAWPASHCEAYVQNCCAAASQSSEGPKKNVKARNAGSDEENYQSSLLEASVTHSPGQSASSPLRAALSAHNSLPSLTNSTSAAASSSLWLNRVCRTASHELGHCFGIDHCVYYACIMQGSASLMEDSRQPPYLCPIDMAKVLQATGADERQHYLALLSFCNQHRGTHAFRAFAAWIEVRLEEIRADK